MCHSKDQLEQNYEKGAISICKTGRNLQQIVHSGIRLFWQLKIFSNKNNIDEVSKTLDWLQWLSITSVHFHESISIANHQKNRHGNWETLDLLMLTRLTITVALSYIFSSIMVMSNLKENSLLQRNAAKFSVHSRSNYSYKIWCLARFWEVGWAKIFSISSLLLKLVLLYWILEIFSIGW